jgi:hypothetical protein
MKIQNFNEHKSGKLLRLTKEELDKMSKSEIEDYKLKFSVKYIKYDNKIKTWAKDENFDYLNELDVYIEVRFKQDKFDQYDEWIRKANNNEGSTENDKRTYKLLASMLTKENGKENMYNISLSSHVKKVGGEFKYILGIELDEEALKPFMEIQNNIK